MLALPWAATAGVLVRSPSSDSIGSSLISPCTVSFRCTLDWDLVVSLDSFSRVAASGSSLDESCDFEEHPAMRAMVANRAAKMAKRRVCMTAS